jgi:hypothetical protein
MKIGDLVRRGGAAGPNRIGIVVEMIQKKVWRTSIQGKKVNWNEVDPEPHAVVLLSEGNGTISIPVVELELIHEGR